MLVLYWVLPQFEGGKKPCRLSLSLSLSLSLFLSQSLSATPSWIHHRWTYMIKPTKARKLSVRVPLIISILHYHRICLGERMDVGPKPSSGRSTQSVPHGDALNDRTKTRWDETEPLSLPLINSLLSLSLFNSLSPSLLECVKPN